MEKHYRKANALSFLGAFCLLGSTVAPTFAPAQTLSTAPPVVSEVAARALVKPWAETTLASRLSTRIISIHKTEGARFKKGATLVTFDCAVQRANLKKADAELFQAGKTLEAQQKLQRLNAVRELELALAKANIQKAEADVAIMKAEVTGCTIAAPFDGRVVALEAQAFEHVTPGQPVLEILDDTAMRLEILAPASVAVKLGPGSPVIVRIDETQKVYQARVRATGANVDPASQTLQVYADVDGRQPDLLPGMSGTAQFSIGN